MTRTGQAWAKWKALARRAAVAQSNVLLWLLYYVMVVPLALLRRPFDGRRESSQPSWRERPASDADRLATARRQF